MRLQRQIQEAGPERASRSTSMLALSGPKLGSDGACPPSLSRTERERALVGRPRSIEHRDVLHSRGAQQTVDWTFRDGCGARAGER